MENSMIVDALADYFRDYVVPFGPRLVMSGLLLVALWLVGRLMASLVTRFGQARNLDVDLTGILASSVSIAFLLVGGVTALGTIGVDVTALVAGLGLTGFALGFALKDIIANALSGIMILAYKPFERTNRIRVTTFEGTVVKIDLRYTILQTEGQQVFLPNSMLVNNAVVVLN
jgi:small conductance mechanosensitive channel